MFGIVDVTQELRCINSLFAITALPWLWSLSYCEAKLFVKVHKTKNPASNHKDMQGNAKLHELLFSNMTVLKKSILVFKVLPSSRNGWWSDLEQGPNWTSSP